LLVWKNTLTLAVLSDNKKHRFDQYSQVSIRNDDFSEENEKLIHPTVHDDKIMNGIQKGISDLSYD